jgi:type I site-specific restriction endonuclease
MTTQPEALRLADVLDYVELRPSDYKDVDKAAAELRRLHELNVDKTEIIAALSAVNQELLEALRWIERRCPAQLLLKDLHRIHMEAAHDAGACARAAIAKATGEPK